MQVNRDQFLEQGFLILPQVVPPQLLETLRAQSEIMVARRKVGWIAERGPDDPPGGAWETSNQPRLHLHNTPELVDAQTAAWAEFWLHENTHGVSAALLDMPHAAVTEMMMMCNPVSDRGPAAWHRDIHPFDTAPLQGYIDHIRENGPRYVQWNIPLYDDDVLWVVPGSHLRLNTPEEQQQLDRDPRVPLPGAIQTHLKAGDGVVYITPILHWGSNYSSRQRRTLHGGYCNFTAYPELGFTRHLSDAAQDTFARWKLQSARSQEFTEQTLRAALSGDAAAYRAGLEALQSGMGPQGHWLLTVYLGKAAAYIHTLRNGPPQDIEACLHPSAEGSHPTTLNWGPPFAQRFAPAEAAALWQRFAPLDDALKSPDNYVAGFQGQAVPYRFNEMPPDLDLETFLASWS